MTKIPTMMLWSFTYSVLLPYYYTNNLDVSVICLEQILYQTLAVVGVTHEAASLYKHDITCEAGRCLFVFL